jgi:hypothetical protein
VRACMDKKACARTQLLIERGKTRAQRKPIDDTVTVGELLWASPESKGGLTLSLVAFAALLDKYEANLAEEALEWVFATQDARASGVVDVQRFLAPYRPETEPAGGRV